MKIRTRLLERMSLNGFPWKSAISIYTFSWGWLFFIRDSIWSDDWDLFAFHSFTNENFGDYGIPPWRWVDLLIYELFGAPSLRALTFLGFLFISIFAYGISAKISNLRLSQRQAIALLSLVLPFNSARISLMVVSYTFGYFYFLLAWYLIVNFKGSGIKIACLLLFFLSYGALPSTIFFYLFPVTHYFILAGVKNWSDFKAWVRRNTLFVTLPLIYVFSENIFWPQKNGHLAFGLIDLTRLIWTIPLFGLILLIYVIGRKFLANSKTEIHLIVAGLSMMLVASLPYIIYGTYRCCQIAFVEDYLAILFGRRGWDSRHHILQPIGAAFFLVGLVSIAPRVMQKLRNKTIGLILLASILMNLNFGVEAFTEYSKHLKVVAKIETSGDFKTVEQYVIRDETSHLNFLANQYSSKQWTGLIATATDPSVYKWFEIIPYVGLSKRLVIECQPPENPLTNPWCQPRENSKEKFQNGLSRLIWIRGPSTRFQAVTNLLSDGEIGFDVQVIDLP